MTSREIFGLLSVLLMLLSRGIYFTSILKGRTKPHSFSWLIWGVISGIGFAAQVAKNAGPGSWARGFGAASCWVIVLIGWFRGARDIKRLDWVTLAVSLSAIPLWLITNTPVWSVLLVCLIDTTGYLPTVRKVWHRPEQEAWTGYVVSSVGALFSLLAMENLELSTWLYPAVLVVSNNLMAGFIVIRRRRVPKIPADLGLSAETPVLHA